MVCSLALWLLIGASCSPRGRPSGLWEDELPTEPGFVSCKNIFLSCKKKKNKTCRLRAQVEPEENRKKKPTENQVERTRLFLMISFYYG